GFAGLVLGLIERAGQPAFGADDEIEVIGIALEIEVGSARLIRCDRLRESVEVERRHQPYPRRLTAERPASRLSGQITLLSPKLDVASAPIATYVRMTPPLMARWLMSVSGLCRCRGDVGFGGGAHIIANARVDCGRAIVAPPLGWRRAFDRRSCVP